MASGPRISYGAKDNIVASPLYASGRESDVCAVGPDAAEGTLWIFFVVIWS